MGKAPSSLYSETVLAHNRAPLNYGPLPDATHRGHADNATCGDHVELALRVHHDVVAEARFSGEACAITTASASMLTAMLQGQPPTLAATLRAELVAMFRGEGEARAEFAAFAELRRHPSRQRCALLPFDAASTALKT